MPVTLNDDIAGRLDEVAQLLAEQQANPFRIQAYHRAASELRRLERPVAEIFATEGLAGLDRLPSIGPSIARTISDLLRHGRSGMLDRLRGEHDPIGLLMTVPGIGRAMAAKLHDILGLGKTNDWVVLYWDGEGGEQQCTVITAEFGRLAGRRIVRGREAECEALYASTAGESA